ncbi:MAG: peptidylprolyl isomerase [Myxococcales bacterium]
MRTLAATLVLAGCASGHSAESGDILDRSKETERAEVQHILLAWSALEGSYRGMRLDLDPRAQNRTQKDAEQLASSLLARCKAGEPFEPLMRESSEDPGSATTGMVYTVTPDSRMAQGFVDLALRLKPGECGVVKTQFGLHVVKRVR